MKRNKLNIPIFRQLEYLENGYRISSDKFFKAVIWNRYFYRFGEKAGLPLNLSYYSIRRAVLNAVNSMEFLISSHYLV